MYMLIKVSMLTSAEIVVVPFFIDSFVFAPPIFDVCLQSLELHQVFQRSKL